MNLSPANLEIAMVSFEGPDPYSLAGGLGVRARELTRAFAAAGHDTTLVFVGDPQLAPEELSEGVRLIRVGQEVSRRHPSGVYAGEREKLEAITWSLPDALIQRVIAPAVERDRVVAVLCEEWHTAALVPAAAAIASRWSDCAARRCWCGTPTTTSAGTRSTGGRWPPRPRSPR